MPSLPGLFCSKIVLNMFRVLLQNKFGANHTLPWWYCILHNDLLVFLSIGDTVYPDQISNLTCKEKNQLQTCTEPPPGLTVTHYCTTLQPSPNFCHRKTFAILSHQHLLVSFCTPCPMFLCTVESHGLVAMSVA